MAHKVINATAETLAKFPVRELGNYPLHFRGQRQAQENSQCTGEQLQDWKRTLLLGSALPGPTLITAP